MKSHAAISVLLAAGLLAACNMPGNPLAAPARPAEPGVPAPAPGAVPAVPELPEPSVPCLESGSQAIINAQLQGVGAIAVLCPQAVFELTSPVTYSAPDQQVYTQGRPTGNTRATLRIVAPGLASAVTMRDFDGAVLSNVIVDGNRTNLGPLGGDALIYAGGYSDGQVISNNKIMDTRSWSALQVIQGHDDTLRCQHALVEDNEIGPAGTSDDLLWADGISFTCMNSTVSNNVITDATDGGIVIFAAPGSIIEGNTVRAETRTMLGGINMVDEDVYEGHYTGTIVRNNIIDASGAVIRIGLGMGPRVWGCFPQSETGHVISGGTVTGNTLRGAHMQYGFIVDGVTDWTVTGNIDEATHSGTPSNDCGGLLASQPAGFQRNVARSQGTFQPEFAEAHLDLALWAITSPRPGE